MRRSQIRAVQHIDFKYTGWPKK